MFLWLLLGHSAVGALVMAGFRADEQLRRSLIVLGAGLGAGLALALAVSGGGSWRSLALTGDAAILLGAGAGSSWFLVALRRVGGSSSQSALSGVAITAALLSAASAWTVPLLLFLACFGLAGWGAARRANHGFGGLRVGTGTLLIAGAFIARLLDEVWTLPESLDWWQLAVLVGGLTLLAVPPGEPGSEPAPPSTALGPVAVTMAFAYLVSLSAGPSPELAGAVLVFGLVVMAGTWKWWGRGTRALATWAFLTMLAAALAVPDLTVGAGIACALAFAASGLRPGKGGYSGLLRGVVVGLVPPTLGGVVLVSAALGVFGRAMGSTSQGASVPWSLLSGLLPLALAAGVLVTARMGRGARVALGSRASVMPLSLFGVAFVFGFLPRTLGRLPSSPLGAEGGVILTYLLAAGAGACAAWFVYSRQDATIESVDSSEGLVGEVTPGPGSRWVEAFAGVTLLSALLAILWVTVQGLSVGFL